MYQGTRKFVANQRSVPKQSRPSYQQFTSNAQKQLNHPYYAKYGPRKELTKNNSDADLRHPKEQYFKNLNQRRKNQGQMSNLKSELQNLKSEVNKLISKQSALKTPQKQKVLLKQFKSEKRINFMSKGYAEEFTDRQDDFNDTASMSSVTTEKVLNQPLRRLQKNFSTQNYDPGYYMQLENDLLKTEIKNLKNKYVSKKRQLSQKCDLLQKKNQYLEVSLQKSQESLAQCRKALEMEIMAIKRQISFKTQIKDQNQAQTDKIGDGGNQMLKQKLKRVYEQMSQKNKLANSLNTQLGQMQVMLQRKKFDLKKQTQKNLQLSKQIQLSKRQNSRLQQLIQTQLSKKKDISKENQYLKQRNKDLMTEIYAKEQIVTGSQQYQNRLSEELEQYRQKQNQLQLKLTTLRQQNKKIKQILDSDKDQINYLKKNTDDTLSRVAVLSKKLKEQQEKGFERQDHYRKIIQQHKKKENQKIKIIKQQYESQTAHITDEVYKKQENQSQQVNELLRQKDKQINKWKAEYKILKLKHQEKHTSEKLKKQQIDEYYKGYIQYKQSCQVLEERNQNLQKNVQKYLKMMSQKQNYQMRLDLEHTKLMQSLKAQTMRIANEHQSTNDELEQLKNQLSESNLKNEHQIKYRQELQQKIERYVHRQLHGESSEEEQPEQNDTGNDQKETKQVPQKSIKFLQDDEQNLKNDQSQKIDRKVTKPKVQNPPKVELSQSQKLQLQQLSQAITTIKKRVVQQDQKLSKNVRQLKNKDSQINKLKKQIRQLLQTHERQLLQIKGKYASDRVQMTIKATLDSQRQVKQLCHQQIKIHKQKNAQVLAQNVQMKKKISQVQKQLLELRQQTKSLSHLYNVKCSQVQQIFQKNYYQLSLKQNKIDEMQTLRQHRQRNLLSQISNLKDQIMSLRLQIKSQNSMNQHIQTGNFDKALKSQIQNNKTSREQLAKKNQELFKVRDNYTLLRSQYDNLRSQCQIQKLKFLSEKKNIQVQYQIQIQNLKNINSVEEKKISSLQQKIALVIEQNKKKDSFIQSYIMGKKLPQGDKQFVSQFVKQYEILLSGKSINEKLDNDSHQLQKMALYNYSLLKDMADMKQRMLLYETMQGQALSLYDSKHGGQKSRQSDFDSPNTLSSKKKFKKMHSLADQQIDFDSSGQPE